MAINVFASKHPIWFVATTELFLIAIYLIGRSAVSTVGLSDHWPETFANGVLAATLVIVLTRMRWWSRVGYRGLLRPRDLLLFLPTLLPVLLNLSGGLYAPNAEFVTGMLLLALMVGFVEESIGRGLWLQALLPLGVWKAVVASSLLFGVTHLLNVAAGKEFVDVGAQVAYASAIGFAFAALAVRTRVIWPLVVVHALIDFASFLRPPTDSTQHAPWIVVAAISVVYTGYGLWVMRRMPTPKVQAVNVPA